MKKILVPVDGSKASIKAVKTAVEMAQKEGAALTLITVVREVIGYGSTYGSMVMVGSGELQKVNEINHLNAKKALEKIVEDNVPQGVQVEEMVVTGSDADEIIREATRGKYDLIVIGRRGLSKMHRFFVGSVTQRVLAETPCAVYVEKEDED